MEMKMKLVNLTPNTVTVFDETGRDVLMELPTDPPAVFAEEDAQVVHDLGKDVLVIRQDFWVDPDNLPDPEEGVLFVVGLPVIQALRDMRHDLIAPDTGRNSAVKDARGRIIGVRRFKTL